MTKIFSLKNFLDFDIFFSKNHEIGSSEALSERTLHNFRVPILVVFSGYLSLNFKDISFHLNTSNNLAPGVYIVKSSANGKDQSSRMIVK